MASSYYHQMHKQLAVSTSDLNTSSHNTSNSSNNNNGRSISTNTAKVLSKINTLIRPSELYLKSRPHPKRPPPPPPSERFQIVHTPDRSSVTIPLWEIPRTEEEYKAAIKNMKMQGQLLVEGERVQQADVAERDVKVEYDRFPPSPSTPSGTANVPLVNAENTLTPRAREPRNPGFQWGHHSISIDPFDAGEVPAKGHSEAHGERGGPPRPSTALRTRTNPYGSARRAHDGEGFKDGRFAIDPDTTARRGIPQRQMSIDSLLSNDGEDAAADNRHSSRPGVLSVRQNGSSRESGDIHGIGSVVTRIPVRTKCYVCLEPCKSGAGLCSECKDRFQPLEEVFEEGSESEYEDEQADSRHPTPRRSTPAFLPVTPPRTKRRGDTVSPAKNTFKTASPRSWSGLSSASQQVQQARTSRSMSVSPTPHLALQLKLVPHPTVRQVSVTSPARNTPEDRRSALHHVQQEIVLREPMTPGAGPDRGRDGIRVGSVHSGEVRLVGDDGGEKGDAGRESWGCYGDWFRYYEKEGRGADGGGEYVSGFNELVSPITNCDLFGGCQNRASARSSTYDRIFSIYNAYFDQNADEEDGGMF
ncbi:hypothetical protein VP1G_08006 [Cytospora mali]|uniref:Uncharacterized protein n=1 Tax=Cytospora mali TaxID=578113 RepID=A0A194VA10_CYTMA|nr:hypothetical protein VP1G_08006 [Valsa mali var. pyri (nom. inval.)]